MKMCMHGFQQILPQMHYLNLAQFENIWAQSHNREVLRWEIFMEQELTFGLDLDRMANFPAFIASKSFDL